MGKPVAKVTRQTASSINHPRQDRQKPSGYKCQDQGSSVGCRSFQTAAGDAKNTDLALAFPLSKSQTTTWSDRMEVEHQLNTKQDKYDKNNQTASVLYQSSKTGQAKTMSDNHLV